MGVLDAIQKNCEPRKSKVEQAEPAIATTDTQAVTQPGRTSDPDGASCPSESSGSSGWPGYGPQVLPSPCRSCGTPAAWELVYDGSLHCPECEPPPGRALVRRWWTIWLRPRRPDDGPIPPGFATARFSGAGLTPEWIEMDHPKRI